MTLRKWLLGGAFACAAQVVVNAESAGPAATQAHAVRIAGPLPRARLGILAHPPGLQLFKADRAPAGDTRALLRAIARAAVPAYFGRD